MSAGPADDRLYGIVPACLDRHFTANLEWIHGAEPEAVGRHIQDLGLGFAVAPPHTDIEFDVHAMISGEPFALLENRFMFHLTSTSAPHAGCLALACCPDRHRRNNPYACNGSTVPRCTAMPDQLLKEAGCDFVYQPKRKRAAERKLEQEQGGKQGVAAPMVWTPEQTYDKPDISVRATTLYYEIMAPIILPFLSGRLLNLFRCREGKCFFQRNREHPPSAGEFERLVRFEPVAQKNGRTEDYLYVASEDEIVACAKAQTVEFHGWASRAGAVETPDRLVIDLDPDPALAFDAVRDAALQVRRTLEAISLESFAMLTGGKGIHIIVPIKPVAAWDEVRKFAKTFCTALATAEPDKFTVALPKRDRRGRIFLDFLRNQRTATAIQPYSARARTGMPVATPVGWDELQSINRADSFTIADVEELSKRAKSSKLRNWAKEPEILPRLR